MSVHSVGVDSLYHLRVLFVGVGYDLGLTVEPCKLVGLVTLLVLDPMGQLQFIFTSWIIEFVRDPQVHSALKFGALLRLTKLLRVVGVIVVRRGHHQLGILVAKKCKNLSVDVFWSLALLFCGVHTFLTGSGASLTCVLAIDVQNLFDVLHLLINYKPSL